MITYYLYEETLDEGSGDALERLHSHETKSFAVAQAFLVIHPRYDGIDAYDDIKGEWHCDVTAPIEPTTEETIKGD
jgi:hypothetical protein